MLDVGTWGLKYIPGSKLNQHVLTIPMIVYTKIFINSERWIMCLCPYQSIQLQIPVLCSFKNQKCVDSILFHSIPSPKLSAGYFHSIEIHLLMDNAINSMKGIMCLCLYQSIQQSIPVEQAKHARTKYTEDIRTLYTLRHHARSTDDHLFPNNIDTYLEKS